MKPKNTIQLHDLTTLHSGLCIVERRTSCFVRYDAWCARKKACAALSYLLFLRFFVRLTNSRAFYLEFSLAGAISLNFDCFSILTRGLTIHFLTFLNPWKKKLQICFGFFRLGFSMSWAEPRVIFEKTKNFSATDWRRKDARKVLRELELGRRVPGGSSERAAWSFNQVWPGQITCRGRCNNMCRYEFFLLSWRVAIKEEPSTKYQQIFCCCVLKVLLSHTAATRVALVVRAVSCTRRTRGG